MLAGCFVPVMSFIGGPSILVGVIVTVVPGALVTEAVVIAINVSAGFKVWNTMSAGCLEGVALSIVFPFVGVLVIKVPSASVTDGNVLTVGMLAKVCYNVVSAGCCMPVIDFIAGPFVSIGVLAELIFTDLADTVIVLVNVRSSVLLNGGVTAA